MTYNLDIKERNKKRRQEWQREGEKHKRNAKGNAAFTRALLMPNSVKECVTKTRLELFGSQEPPFSDIEKMGEWLMEEHRTQPPAEGHAPRYGYRMEQDVTPEQLQAMNATRPGIYGLEFAKLPYPAIDQVTKQHFVSNVIVSDGTRLRRLWLAVQYIAKQLDCQEAQATALILVGLLPLVSALSAKTPQTFRKDQPSSGKIEITIREPVPEDVLIKAYRKLRKALWGHERDRQPASNRDCKLVEFVMQNLDADNPQWESLMNKWNKEYPDFVYNYNSGWRGFRKMYEDAKQKVYPDIHWGNVTLAN